MQKRPGLTLLKKWIDTVIIPTTDSSPALNPMLLVTIGPPSSNPHNQSSIVFVKDAGGLPKIVIVSLIKQKKINKKI
jgi:hypothetical protein